MEQKTKEMSANKKVLDFNTKANSERVAKLKSNYKAKFTEQEKRMASTVRANEQLVAKNHKLDNSNREFKKKEQQRREKRWERLRLKEEEEIKNEQARLEKEEIEKKMKETQQQKSREDAEQQQRRMEEREKKTIAAQQQKERENYSKVKKNGCTVCPHVCCSKNGHPYILTEGVLNKHLRSHTQTECIFDGCSQTFKETETLRRHCRLAHKYQLSQEFKLYESKNFCVPCNVKFSDTKALELHMRCIHAEFRCGNCNDMSTLNKDEMTAHLHEGCEKSVTEVTASPAVASVTSMLVVDTSLQSMSINVGVNVGVKRQRSPLATESGTPRNGDNLKR